MTGNINKRFIWVLLLLASIGTARAQESSSVLLTGVVMDADQQIPIPFVNIRLSGTNYGTAADSNGHFTLFVNPGDTLQFSSVGYTSAVFVMPMEVNSNQYSLIKLLRQETIMLSEIVVFPWPSIEQFKDAFIDVDPGIPDDQQVREVQLRVMSEVKDNELDEYEAEQMQYQKLYELNGIFPPNNFLNPMRWSNFLRDVKKKD